MRGKSYVAIVAGMYLSSTFLPTLVSAQQNAFCIPKSDRVILGELTFPNTSGKDGKVRFAVRDGTWVTVEDTKANYFFAFNGIINDQTGKPNFVPYRLTRSSGSATKVFELDKSASPSFTSPDLAAPSRDIAIGKAVTFTSARGITLKVTGTSERTFAAPYISDLSQYSEQDLDQALGEWGDSVCCVTCQSRTVCASEVDTSCGHCGGGGGGFMVM